MEFFWENDYDLNRQDKSHWWMKILSSLTAAIAIGASLMMAAPPAKAETTYLVLSTYKQRKLTSKPQVDISTSPSIQIIPMESVEQCEAAGIQITEDLYKPIWQFDGRWTCVEGK